MPDNEELAARLSAVEQDVRRLRADRVEVPVVRAEVAAARADASASRALAAGAYEEVGDVRAKLDGHTRVLQALREDQLDLRAGLTEFRGEVDARFAQVDARFAQVDANFAQVDANFAQVDANFAKVHEGLAHIVGLLNAGTDTGGGASSG